MANTAELLEHVKIDFLDLSCNQEPSCDYDERLLSYAIGIQVPQPAETPEEIFKECCYTHIVLADANSSDDLKNDYSSFYHQRQLSNETVDFVLYEFDTDQEHDLDSSLYGQFFDFGSFSQNPDFKGYVVSWKKVLSELGTGSYKIIKRQTIAGVDFEEESLVYTLRQYSDRNANKTVRMDIVMNGNLQKIGVDFTDLNWKDSIRVRGFFGNREPQFEEDNLVSRLFERRQISMSQTNEYKFQTNLIPSCVTSQIWDFFLFGNDIFMTDYNLNNHSYNFKKFGVKYGGNENTEYNPSSRKVRLNLLFIDKILNNRKNNFY